MKTQHLSLEKPGWYDVKTNILDFAPSGAGAFLCQRLGAGLVSSPARTRLELWVGQIDYNGSDAEGGADRFLLAHFRSGARGGGGRGIL